MHIQTAHTHAYPLPIIKAQGVHDTQLTSDAEPRFKADITPAPDQILTSKADPPPTGSSPKNNISLVSTSLETSYKTASSITQPPSATVTIQEAMQRDLKVLETLRQRGYWFEVKHKSGQSKELDPQDFLHRVYNPKHRGTLYIHPFSNTSPLAVNSPEDLIPAGYFLFNDYDLNLLPPSHRKQARLFKELEAKWLVFSDPQEGDIDAYDAYMSFIQGHGAHYYLMYQSDEVPLELIKTQEDLETLYQIITGQSLPETQTDPPARQKIQSLHYAVSQELSFARDFEGYHQLPLLSVLKTKKPFWILKDTTPLLKVSPRELKDPDTFRQNVDEAIEFAQQLDDEFIDRYRDIADTIALVSKEHKNTTLPERRKAALILAKRFNDTSTFNEVFTTLLKHHTPQQTLPEAAGELVTLGSLNNWTKEVGTLWAKVNKQGLTRNLSKKQKKQLWKQLSKLLFLTGNATTALNSWHKIRQIAGTEQIDKVLKTLEPLNKVSPARRSFVDQAVKTVVDTLTSSNVDKLPDMVKQFLDLNSLLPMTEDITQPFKYLYGPVTEQQRLHPELRLQEHFLQLLTHTLSFSLAKRFFQDLIESSSPLGLKEKLALQQAVLKTDQNYDDEELWHNYKVLCQNFNPQKKDAADLLQLMSLTGDAKSSKKLLEQLRQSGNQDTTLTERVAIYRSIFHDSVDKTWSDYNFLLHVSQNKQNLLQNASIFHRTYALTRDQLEARKAVMLFSQQKPDESFFTLLKHTKNSTVAHHTVSLLRERGFDTTIDTAGKFLRAFKTADPTPQGTYATKYITAMLSRAGDQTDFEQLLKQFTNTLYDTGVTTEDSDEIFRSYLLQLLYDDVLQPTTTMKEATELLKAFTKLHSYANNLDNTLLFWHTLTGWIKSRSKTEHLPVSQINHYIELTQGDLYDLKRIMKVLDLPASTLTADERESLFRDISASQYSLTQSLQLFALLRDNNTGLNQASQSLHTFNKLLTLTKDFQLSLSLLQVLQHKLEIDPDLRLEELFKYLAKTALQGGDLLQALELYGGEKENISVKKDKDKVVIGKIVIPRHRPQQHPATD